MKKKYKNEHKTLLVLDLDETLIYAFNEKEKDRKSDFKIFHYKVLKRPYLDEFLNEVAKDYSLAVWSSASDDYVEEIVKNIIPSHIQLELIWGRSRCTPRRNMNRNSYDYYADYNSHFHYVKPLKKLKRQGFKLERILIVDDTPHKSQDNYGNAIYPTEFKGDKDDNELEQLTKYLKLLKDIENVRTIEKRNWRSQVL